MYAAIRQAKVKPGSAEELTRRINEEGLPIIRSIRGFKAYYVVYRDDDMVTTVSVFEDQAAAEECNRRIMDFIRQDLGPMLASQPVALAGTVIVHQAG
jgi:hypothetical protein